MKTRYSGSDVRTASCKRRDKKSGMRLTLELTWQQDDPGEETFFFISYSARAKSGEVIMLRGLPDAKSYRDLLVTAKDESVEGAELILYTASLPQRDVPADYSTETTVWIPLSGQMGFGEFLRDAADEFTPEKAQEEEQQNVEAPRSKDRLN